MPRTTRAALRSKELAEEEAVAASVPLLQTPQKERVPLGDIANNKGAGLILTDSAETEPVKQGGKKGRKPKGAKKGNNKRAKDITENADIEIMEDGNQSSASSAAEEARAELFITQGDHIPSVTDHGSTAPSPAANMASKKLKSTTTPHTDAEHSQPQQEETGKTIAPANEHGSVDGVGEEVKEDSFVQQIKSRSPAERVSRIEDSVEALDRLEEEIEMVGQAITPPPMAIGLPPPPKTDQPDSTLSKDANGKVVNDNARLRKSMSSKAAGESSKPVKRSVPGAKGIQPKQNRASLLRQGIKPISPPRAERSASSAKASGPHATTRAPSATGTKRTSPVGNGSSQSGKPPAPSSKRVSSVTKAPFQPVKSTKVPTQPTFELPGEAISRKKKEQREARLKREEEEKLSKRSFKARPMSMGHAPEIRMTAAAKGRLSVAKQPATEMSQKPTKRPSPLTSSVGSLSSIRRSSSLTVPKRTTPLANSTARRAPSRTSVSGDLRSAPTVEDLAHQKVKGKEAFSRPKNEMAAREKERREKEEAAKKARIEAAERGRAASRAWAEKQKVRKASETAANGKAVA